jgi:hypothetical protein
MVENFQQNVSFRGSEEGTQVPNPLKDLPGTPSFPWNTNNCSNPNSCAGTAESNFQNCEKTSVSGQK